MDLWRSSEEDGEGSSRSLQYSVASRRMSMVTAHSSGQEVLKRPELLKITRRHRASSHP